MEKIILLIFVAIIVMTQNCYSQDVITKKSGEEIKAKILEVTQTEIKFRNFKNLDGPLYSIFKQDVFMIKYENGEEDIFEGEKATIDKNDQFKIIFTSFGIKILKGTEKITREKFNSIIIKDSKAYDEYKSGLALRTTGLIIMIPSAVIFGWQLAALSNESNQYQGSNVALAVSGVTTVGSIILASVGGSRIKKSVDIYNRTNKLSLNFNVSSCNLCISLNY